MTLQIISNRRPRDTLDWRDLTPRERADFDYLDTEDRRDSATFVRYRGAAYDLGEFMRPSGAESAFAKWDGIHTDSYFSAVLCRFVDGGERVIMARAYS